MKITKNYLKALIKEELERYEEVTIGPRQQAAYKENLDVLNKAKVCCLRQIENLFFQSRAKNKPAISVKDIEGVIEYLASQTQYEYVMYMDNLERQLRDVEQHRDNIRADRAERKKRVGDPQNQARGTREFNKRLRDFRTRGGGTRSALATGGGVVDMEAE